MRKKQEHSTKSSQYTSRTIEKKARGLVLLGPVFLLLVFALAVLLDRQIFVLLVFILLGREVFVVLVFLV
ncbi:hypothetical protein T12_5276 [Trichinella patagoniensis]|uniref:Uncharacterized protein n=1 Tax=Trichinella patagoniensis TaxID=990121 RepID=A0A0V0YRA4_9BILA|nr:hypothetical protein T12_5276 [Trichinella patagoniensis]